MNKCLNCDAELESTPKKREKIFCNSTCRSNYWQKADRLEKQGKTVAQIIKAIPTIPDVIKHNNKPKNKKRILDERNPPHESEMQREIREERERRLSNLKK